MIAKITGILDEIGQGWAIVTANGVGYQAHCSSRTLGALPPQGTPVTLWVEMAFKQDQVILYGFQTATEKACFEILQTVQGVGGKVALAILSLMSPTDVVRSLELKDRVPFGQADGVGPKLAQRIVNELSDKKALWSKLLPLGAQPTHHVASVAQDALSALMNLGYRRPEVEEVLRKVQEAAGDAQPALDVTLTQALQLLSQKAS